MDGNGKCTGCLCSAFDGVFEVFRGGAIDFALAVQSVHLGRVRNRIQTEFTELFFNRAKFAMKAGLDV